MPPQRILLTKKPEGYTGSRKGKFIPVYHVVIFNKLHITALPRKYVVHHCDFDRYNNNFNNLVLMTRSMHTRLHNCLRHLPKKYLSKRETLNFIQKFDSWLWLF